MQSSKQTVWFWLGIALLLGGSFLAGRAVVHRLAPKNSEQASIPRLLETSSTTSFIATTSEAVVDTIVSAESVTLTPTTTPAAHLLFVGDIMLDRTVKTRMQNAKNLAYPFQKLPTDWVSSFDYAVANLEGVITEKSLPPEKSIDFRFDPAVVPMLKAQGFDAFSQANNHALDQGTKGYLDTVATLRQNGLFVFGHQVRDDEIALATTTIQGKTFAFVGWNSTDNPIDTEQAAKAIRLARSQADYVIAFMHWGAEYQDHPLSSVVDFSHWLIDQGVDIVIGGHPHWVQGIYSYKGHPVLYSLGNFVFDQDWSPETKQGLAVGLTITGREVTVTPLPVQIQASQPELVTGDVLIARLNALAKISDPTLRAQVASGTVRFTLP